MTRNAGKAGRPAGGSKIPDTVREYLVERVHSGAWTQAQALRYLESEHGIRVSQPRLSQLISAAKRAAGLAHESKAVAREELAPSIQGAVASLATSVTKSAELVARAASLYEAAPENPIRANNYSKVANAYCRLHEILQKSSGLDQPDEKLDGLAGLFALTEDERTVN